MAAVNYVGTWNAGGGSPPSLTLHPGDYWVVVSPGNYSLAGPTADNAIWLTGDWALYDGTYWQRVLGGALPATGLGAGSDDATALNLLLVSTLDAQLPVPPAYYAIYSTLIVKDGGIFEGQGAPSENYLNSGPIVPVIVPKPPSTPPITSTLTAAIYSRETRGIGIRNLMIDMEHVTAQPSSVITNIDNSAPAVVTTAAAHNLNPNDIVYITCDAGMYQQQISVTTLTSTGTTATAMTPTPTSSTPNFATGDVVWIDGATPSGYNGPVVVTVVNSTQFSYTVPSGLAAATGTITASVSLVDNKHFVVDSCPSPTQFTLRGTDFSPNSQSLPVYDSSATATVQQRPCGLMLESCWFFNVENVSVVNVNDNCIGVCLIGAKQGTYWGNLTNVQVLRSSATDQLGIGYLLQGRPENPIDFDHAKGTAKVTQVAFSNCRARRSNDGWLMDECGGGLVMTSCTAEDCATDGMRITRHSATVYPVVIGGEYSNNGNIGINGLCLIINSPIAVTGTQVATANNAVWMRLLQDGLMSFPATFQPDSLVDVYTHQALSGASDTILPTTSIIRISSSSAIQMSSNPQIQAAATIGQVLLLMGSSDTDAITLINGSGVTLRSSTLTLGRGQWVAFRYMGDITGTPDLDWAEIARSDSNANGVLSSSSSPTLAPWQNEIYMTTGSTNRTCTLPPANIVLDWNTSS